MTLAPCPFCGRDDLLERDRLRDAGGFLVRDECGEWLAVSCTCGCRLYVHVDELTDRLLAMDYSDDDLWRVMESRWNDRRTPRRENEPRVDRGTCDTCANQTLVAMTSDPPILVRRCARDLDCDIENGHCKQWVRGNMTRRGR